MGGTAFVPPRRQRGDKDGELEVTCQAFVSGDGKLSLALSQRSADSCIGLASNRIGLAPMVHMLAKEADLEPGEAIWHGMDVHPYLNHSTVARSTTACIKLLPDSLAASIGAG